MRALQPPCAARHCHLCASSVTAALRSRPALAAPKRARRDPCADLAYDPSFAVRGIAYDTQRGTLVKLDFLHAVAQGAPTLAAWLTLYAA